MAIWHVDMFPRIFKPNSGASVPSSVISNSIDKSNDYLIQEGSLRPSIKGSSLINRSKYKRKALLVADFSPIEDGYSVNRLYTTILISIGLASFIFLTYGLQSIFSVLEISS